MESQKTYFAKGLTVHKSPVSEAVNGGKRISVGFPVCTVSEYIGEEGATAVAEMLNLAELSQKPKVEAPISDAIVEIARLTFKSKIMEYDIDFQRPSMTGEPWAKKYGTNLHSTALGEQWAMRSALEEVLRLRDLEADIRQAS